MAGRPKRPRRAEPAPRGERLQKVLAAAGVASRRAAESLMLEGRVTVNGAVASELGVRIDPERDRVRVDGRAVRRLRTNHYYVLYKPRGVLSTSSDPRGDRTVLELLPERPGLFPVGRLDRQSEGLLLVTNDGPVAHALLHPSFEVPRTYRVSVDGAVRAPALRELGSGVEVEEGRTSPCEVRILSQDEDRSVVELTLIEGRRHQIRQMMEAVGHPVRRLVRIRHGPLELGSLGPGAWRPASAREREALRRMVAQALPPRGRATARPDPDPAAERRKE